MKKYETVVIFDPMLTEGTLKEEVKKVQKLFEQNGAQNVQADHWGKKEIAYPIKKKKYGFFVQYSYQGEKSELVDTVTKVLNITDSVLKAQTQRLPEQERKFKGRRRTRPNVLERGDFGDVDFSESVEVEY